MASCQLIRLWLNSQVKTLQICLLFDQPNWKKCVKYETKWQLDTKLLIRGDPGRGTRGWLMLYPWVPSRVKRKSNGRKPGALPTKVNKNKREEPWEAIFTDQFHDPVEALSMIGHKNSLFLWPIRAQHPPWYFCWPVRCSLFLSSL